MTRRSPIAGIRQKYVLDDDDMIALAELAKPRLLTLADQETPQEKSNQFWAILGEKHGFQWDTVIRDPQGADPGYILAVPIGQEHPFQPLAPAKPFEPGNDL